MDEEIVTLYCLCDDFLKSRRHREDPQRQMCDAEVMTTALVAMRHFGGNLDKARRWLQAPTYVPGMLSKSRLTRRVHALEETFQALFSVVGELWKRCNPETLYLVDSFPVPVCDNVRISRCRLYQAEAYRGYQASKRRFFYGLKVHLLMTAHGQPVECFLTPGSYADVTMFRHFALDLPAGATIYGDKGYTDYEQEDSLREIAEIHLLPSRKKNSKRSVSPEEMATRNVRRKRIETAISVLEQQFPKTIHAVTPRGMELKVFLFVVAYSLGCAL